MKFISHPLFNIAVGAVVTAFFSWFFYMRGGRQFRAEAQVLHVATSAILYYLEHSDAKIHVQRDDKGRVTD